jgi:hypothetical protein
VILANIKEFLKRPYNTLKAIFFLSYSNPSSIFLVFPKAYTKLKQWFMDISKLGINLNKDYSIDSHNIEGVQYLGPNNI